VRRRPTSGAGPHSARRIPPHYTRMVFVGYAGGAPAPKPRDRRLGCLGAQLAERTGERGASHVHLGRVGS
jgi:hypothetical protein